MPYCRKTYCYNSQYEITVYGALMPHLIWGVYDISNKRIIVNPHMFNEQSKKRADNCLWLHIDQSDFDELVSLETKYWKFVTYIPNYKMMDQTV